MSQSLSFDISADHQPAAVSAVEQSTWSRFGLSIGGNVVTRLLDRPSGGERGKLHIPVFPIAEWIVANWWSLLNEPCRTESPTSPAAGRAWTRRHCLRAADSALLLPALYLYSDGYDVVAIWQADGPGDLPHMNGEFVDSGGYRLDLGEARRGLAGAVESVLARLGSTDDDRVAETHANWQAIKDASPEEARFCTVAGRLGVDPYDLGAEEEELAATLGDIATDADMPLNRDLAEATTPDRVCQHWHWVRTSARELGLGPIPAGIRSLSDMAHAANPVPYQRGQALARWLRDRAGLGSVAPVDSVEEAARSVTGAPLVVEERNHLDAGSLRAVVGWRGSGEAVLAGPFLRREESRRWRAACGLHHSLFLCDKSERLVTAAHTHDQQAARAFAAEFLAPQSALVDRVGSEAARSDIDELAAEYRVSSWAIEHQLLNTGVNVMPA